MGTIKHPENNNMPLVNPYLSIIILNVNGLNDPIKGIESMHALRKQNTTVSHL